MGFWSYGWNVPGYSPDAAEGADTWEDARDALVWELERWESEDESSYDAAIAALMAAKAGDAFAYVIDDGRAGVCVWIEPVDNDD